MKIKLKEGRSIERNNKDKIVQCNSMCFVVLAYR